MQSIPNPFALAAGTEQGMRETFGSTCHGAGRARSRNNSRNKLDYQQVLDALKTKGISIRVASPKLVMEEAPESYKVCWSFLASALLYLCHIKKLDGEQGYWACAGQSRSWNACWELHALGGQT